MKKRWVAIVAAVALLPVWVAPPAAADGTPDDLEHQPSLSTGTKTLLVRFDTAQDDPSAAAAAAVQQAAQEVADASIAQVVPITTELAAVRLDSTLEPAEVAAISDQAEATAGVDEVAGSATVTTQATTDTLYSSLWNLSAGSAHGIDAESVWPTTTGAGVVIGVLDTGITAHTDLTGSTTAIVGGNVVAGYDFVSDASVAADGNGRDSNPSDPGDVCPPYASSWHGTHVAGTIAALRDNGAGVVGIAPDAKVQPIRVLGRCHGDEADVISAIRWGAGLSVFGVADNPTPADVLNLSLGGPGYCPTNVQNAIDDAVAQGTAIVVAAGNDASSLANSFPANCNNVIRVTASDTAGAAATFSNYGSASLPAAVAAPGQSILSTVNSGQYGPVAESYDTMSGTSMAAPHVAAAIALLKQVDPTLTPARAAEVLRASAVSLTNTSLDHDYGAGLVNLPVAVRLLQIGAATPAATPPAATPSTFTLVAKPKITGTVKVGKTLKASKGTWTPAATKVTYRWLRNGKAISKATKATYKLVKADRKKKISVKVTVSATGYTSKSATSTSKTVK